MNWHKQIWIEYKFIIAVPSLAIKAGTAQFLQDAYARRHFSDDCGYDADMEVGLLDAPKQRKKDVLISQVLSAIL